MCVWPCNQCNGVQMCTLSYERQKKKETPFCSLGVAVFSCSIILRNTEMVLDFFLRMFCSLFVHTTYPINSNENN